MANFVFIVMGYDGIRNFFFKLLQMDKTTANVVGPRTLGVVASVLAVVCKRMQQLPTLLGPAVNCGKDTTLRLCRPCVMCMQGPDSRAVQMDSTLLCYASAITEQKKCWELLAQKFDQFQTLRNNFQQHATTCNRVCRRTQHVNIQQC